jgi:hypothetical protein
VIRAILAEYSATPVRRTPAISVLGTLLPRANAAARLQPACGYPRYSSESLRQHIQPAFYKQMRERVSRMSARLNRRVVPRSL